MNENNITFKLAKLLKKKGFNCKCLCAYDKDGNLFYEENARDFNKVSCFYSCPTLYDAQKWLREKHNIHIGIEFCDIDDYRFYTTIIDEDGCLIETTNSKPYKTYEKCLNKGIKDGLQYIQDTCVNKEDNAICMFCDSYEDGRCTNFGKDVLAEDGCEHYKRTIIECVCKQCGRKYEITDSDARNRELFCCKACEEGY